MTFLEYLESIYGPIFGNISGFGSLSARRPFQSGALPDPMGDHMTPQPLRRGGDRMTPGPRGPVSGLMPVNPNPARGGDRMGPGRSTLPVISPPPRNTLQPVNPGGGRSTLQPVQPGIGGGRSTLQPVNPGLGGQRGIGQRFENDGRLREPTAAEIQRKLRAVGDPQMRQG